MSTSFHSLFFVWILLHFPTHHQTSLFRACRRSCPVPGFPPSVPCVSVSLWPPGRTSCRVERVAAKHLPVVEHALRERLGPPNWSQNITKSEQEHINNFCAFSGRIYNIERIHTISGWGGLGLGPVELPDEDDGGGGESCLARRSISTLDDDGCSNPAKTQPFFRPPNWSQTCVLSRKLLGDGTTNCPPRWVVTAWHATDST
jgi:hypothetical protein